MALPLDVVEVNRWIAVTFASSAVEIQWQQEAGQAEGKH